VTEGYDLRQVVAEYRSLRRIIAEMYATGGVISAESRPKIRPLEVMHEAIDHAIADAVDQYAIERDRSREMFISILGHDLRDPLGNIAFGAHFLLGDVRDQLPPAAVRTLERIASASGRMERMIDDLLDFARGRLGSGLPIVPVRLDARHLIAETVRDIAHAHPARDIQCRAVSATGDFNVVWDGDRIAQALANIVGNALSHGTDPVVIEPIDNGDSITLAVQNGGEIPVHVLPRLFDPFVSAGGERRANDSDARGGPDRRRGNLGLGLYIVHEIAVAHRGTVTAESEGGRTTFRLKLPRRTPSPARIAP
jgi:signal transduction histidine kinase